MCGLLETDIKREKRDLKDMAVQNTVLHIATDCTTNIQHLHDETILLPLGPTHTPEISCTTNQKKIVK